MRLAFLAVAALERPAPEVMEEDHLRSAVAVGADGHLEQNAYAASGAPPPTATHYPGWGGPTKQPGWQEAQKNDPVCPLKFLHIPKTGGTTIEDIAKDQKVHWGRFAPELAFASAVSKTTPAHEWAEGDSETEWCPTWHVPPSLLAEGSKERKYYGDNPDDVFCVVRNPYDRVLSQVRFHIVLGSGDMTKEEKLAKFCKKEWLNTYLADLKPTDAVNPLGDDRCHFVPQSEYVFDKAGKKICGHVLRFETLQEQFNALMKERDIHVQLGEEDQHNKTPNWKAGCPEMTTDWFSEEVVSNIQEYFADDFAKFEYSDKLSPVHED